MARQIRKDVCAGVLKSMREAFAKDGFIRQRSDASVYQHVYDQQIAQQMTAGKGLGLADMMVKQMTGGQTMPADDAPQVPLKILTETTAIKIRR